MLAAVFYLLSFIIPINEHYKSTDITALVGHFLLIKGNNIIGIVSLLLYYTLYVYRNSQEDKMVNNGQVVGGTLLVLYYGKELIDTYYEKKENKEK